VMFFHGLRTHVYPRLRCSFFHLFFYAAAPTEISTLSLHDALPICGLSSRVEAFEGAGLDEAIQLKERELALCSEEYQRNQREVRSEEHTSELQSRENLVCRLLLEKKKRSHPR